jgi:hypothetical protein|tara:strand:- start:558 stop:773 length:216 start_codon:yes stop_codon:yes gene_type:complete
MYKLFVTFTCVVVLIVHWNEFSNKVSLSKTLEALNECELEREVMISRQKQSIGNIMEKLIDKIVDSQKDEL